MKHVLLLILYVLYHVNGFQNCLLHRRHCNRRQLESVGLDSVGDYNLDIDRESSVVANIQPNTHIAIPGGGMYRSEHLIWQWILTYLSHSSLHILVVIVTTIFFRNLFLLASRCHYLSPGTMLWSLSMLLYWGFCGGSDCYIGNYQCGLLWRHKIGPVVSWGCWSLGSKGWSTRDMGTHGWRMVGRFDTIQ